MILYSLGILLALTAAYVYQQWSYIAGYGIGGSVATRLNASYDYIVVGGGSAGAVVAARLSEDPTVSVVLLEAGGEEIDYPSLNIPMFMFKPEVMEIDWKYNIEKQSNFGKSRGDGFDDIARMGRVLGGTSYVNYMQYVRGNKYDYDSWAKNGCDGWSYKDVLPYFLKSEDFQESTADDRFHSTGGFLSVTRHSGHPVADKFLQVGRELGYDVGDPSGEKSILFSHFYSTTRKGVRSSTSRDLLRPAMRRGNLHVAVNSLVTKVTVDNNRATGIVLINDNKKTVIGSNREVVVSAGTIGSPKLLMLLGIGPKRHLEQLQIPFVADLPVGENLQNHLFTTVWADIDHKPSSVSSNLYLGFLQYLLFQTGPLAMPLSEAVAFIRADGKKDGKPDFQIDFLLMKLDAVAATGDERTAHIKEGPGFTLALFALDPKSRGEVRLKSDDPFDAPIIDPMYFSNPQDIENEILGIRFLMKLLQTSAMKSLNVSVEINKLPMCVHETFDTDEYWACFISYVSSGAFHYTGTCRMGAVGDRTTVVDPRLRVKGVSGLRVADASVMPTVVSGNTNAATIMIAERVADFIKQDWKK